MSHKGCRQIRRGFSRLRKNRAEVAKDLIEELEKAPIKYRFLFAMKLIFHRKR